MINFSFKFLPFKDLFYSVFPTVGTYGGYIKGISPSIFPNVWVAIGAGLVVSILLAMVFYSENVKNYKKSLAEILATGYFMNFTGRLGKLLKTRTPIQFSFPDGSIKTFYAEQISVEIGLPRSLASLNKYGELVERTSEIAYLRESTNSEPFWVRATVHDDQLVIYEFPRTLFSISRYLKSDFSDHTSAEKNSKRIYTYFHQKIEQLRIEYSSEISNDKLNFKMV